MTFFNNIIEQKEKKAMTQAEMLQFQILESFWGRLVTLTDSELMTRRQAEMELGHNLKNVNKEINRRNADA